MKTDYPLKHTQYWLVRVIYILLWINAGTAAACSEATCQERAELVDFVKQWPILLEVARDSPRRGLQSMH